MGGSGGRSPAPPPPAAAALPAAGHAVVPLAQPWPAPAHGGPAARPAWGGGQHCLGGVLPCLGPPNNAPSGALLRVSPPLLAQQWHHELGLGAAAWHGHPLQPPHLAMGLSPSTPCPGCARTPPLCPPASCGLCWAPVPIPSALCWGQRGGSALGVPPTTPCWWPGLGAGRGRFMAPCMQP